MEVDETEGEISTHRKRLAERNGPDQDVMAKKSKKVIRHAELEEPMQQEDRFVQKLAGRVVEIHLEDFMCHRNLTVKMDVSNNNCFFIGGKNGSGKSALFAALNIGLGGRGNNNDRGNSIKQYIKQGKTKALIRLTLTNEGQGSYDKYGQYVIIERSINQSSSSYVLKSVKGKGKDREEVVISRKKADLDFLLIKFGIQLNNPIFWMSQDRSRHFLSSMKPDKLYQIFIVATELEHTSQCYETCAQIIKELEAGQKEIRRDMERKKKEYEELRTERTRMKNILELRGRQEYFLWMLTWCPLRDVLSAYSAVEKKKKKHAEEQSIMKHRILTNRQERQEYIKEAENINEKIVHFNADMDELKNELREKNEGRNQAISECDSLKTNQKTFEREKRLYKDQLTKAKKNMLDLERKLRGGEDNDESDDIEKQIQVKKKQAEELRQRVVKARIELDSYEKGAKEEDEKNKNLRRQHVECKQNIQSLDNTLRKHKAMAENEMARFGREMPIILQVIEQNKHLFTQIPKGPIGRYITLKNKDFVVPVEASIGSFLKKFIFNSKEDQGLLQNLLTRQGHNFKTYPVVYRFDRPSYDTSSFEPESKYTTVMRAINISDDVVRGYLIDAAKIESNLIIMKDQDARALMNGNAPRNAFRAFTGSAALVFGSNAAGHGHYRFYSGPQTLRPSVLDKTLNVDVKDLEKNMDTLRHELKEIEQELNKSHKDMQAIVRKADDSRRPLLSMEHKISSLESEIRTINYKTNIGEQMDDTSLINMQRTCAELEKKIGKIDDDLKELDEVLNEKMEEVDRWKAEADELEKERKEALLVVAPLENDMEGLKKKINKLDATNEQLEAQKKKLDDMMTKFDDELLALDKKKDEATKETEKANEMNTPEGMTNPPDMDKILTTDLANKECSLLQDQIIAAEAKRTKKDLSDKTLTEYKEQYEEIKKHYAYLKRVNNRLRECMNLRIEKFPVMQHAISSRLKVAFNKLMAIRQFSGDLTVDYSKNTINLTVLTHNKREGNSSKSKGDVIQDLKGLSGGERSYATTCFVMALWEIMEAPFRCMDEFDVFMDHVNRKIIMDLMVKNATEEYAHSQFIFFTPQGIKDIQDQKRDRVQIIEMPEVRPEVETAANDEEADN